MKNISFDGILTGANGHKLDVDCNLVLPSISGAAASVVIHIPLQSTPHTKPTNPCTVHGTSGMLNIEIRELHYSCLPLQQGRRKLARGVLDISHIGIIKVCANGFENEQSVAVFHLPPVEFFKRHPASVIVNYSSIPDQTVELFKLQCAKLGEIVFSKRWDVHLIKGSAITANIHSGFYAQVVCSEDRLKKNELSIVESFKEVLTVLSIFFRQAAGLLGWEKRSRTSTETIWINSLQPNIPPYMGEADKQDSFLAFPEEFEKCAEKLVNEYLEADPKVKRVIRKLSVSIAPHISVSTRSRFLSMFSALEEAMNLIKLPAPEQEKLGASNAELIRHLKRMRVTIESESTVFTEELLKRVDGFINLIKGGSPSFSAKIDAFFKEYPGLSVCADDLWPIKESGKKLSLKNIRDKIAHGSYDEIDHQALAVASWHLSIFIERLIFKMLGVTLPQGIDRNSYFLATESWYKPDYWSSLQKAALKK